MVMRLAARPPKTVSRRPLHPSPPTDAGDWSRFTASDGHPMVVGGTELHQWKAPGIECGGMVCPWGQAGDHLLVREPLYLGDNGKWRYRADDEEVLVPRNPKQLAAHRSWLSARTLDGDRSCEGGLVPLWTARTRLRVTGASVARLADVTDDEVMAEGAGSLEEYFGLWSEYHGRADLYTWVWVVRFEKEEG
jgi:hypothetical protein